VYDIPGFEGLGLPIAAWKWQKRGILAVFAVSTNLGQKQGAGCLFQNAGACGKLGNSCTLLIIFVTRCREIKKR